jgi:acyl-CoA thioesterase-2
LRLERIEKNIFRGDSRDVGSPQVFGGQVVGQALSAAQNTVKGRVAHSLHGYFLRRGDVNAPIIYEVDRSRDGGSFSNRRVVAIQHGRPILHLAASFQILEKGLFHQVEMPDVPGPDELKDQTATTKDIDGSLPTKMKPFISNKRPFEFRHIESVNYDLSKKLTPRKHIWIRSIDDLPNNPILHQNLLTYVSDYELLGTATLPHGLSFASGNVIMASLDHAIWFHREFKMDEWLLYVMDSPVSFGARGLARGQIFNREGHLIASTTQEGLMRPVDPNNRKPRTKPGFQS